MTGWMIAGAMALVAVNAFFVAAEFGLVAARRTRIDQLVASGSTRAVIARRAMGELNLLLSGCQLGITFASLGLGWIGEPAFATLLEGTFEPLPSPLDVIARHGVASTLAFGVITLLHVVLGELVPKNLAIAAPERVALWVAIPMRAFTTLFRPVIWLFNEGANRFVRIFGVEPQTELRAAHTLDELRLLLEESRETGAIELSQGEIVARTLVFGDKRSREVMVRRSDVHAVSADEGVDAVVDLARRTGHARFPVYAEHPNDYIGVVHLADMLRTEHRSPGAKVTDAMRELLFVPDSLRLDQLLRQMSKAHTHFAVVLDEYGSTEGIVTREDVVAEVVGDIPDEQTDRPPDVRRVGRGYRVSGSIHLDQLHRATGYRIPPGDYESLGGFVTVRLGRMPVTGDEIESDGLRIRILAVRRRRIVSADLEPIAEPIADPDQRRT
jgi:CBS domain containing-hemolysin-like protein